MLNNFFSIFCWDARQCITHKQFYSMRAYSFFMITNTKMCVKMFNEATKSAYLIKYPSYILSCLSLSNDQVL